MLDLELLNLKIHLLNQLKMIFQNLLNSNLKLDQAHLKIGNVLKKFKEKFNAHINEKALIITFPAL